MWQPGGLATGIGSLPHREPGPALDLISKHFLTIPHWPQLPQRGGQEGFVHQFLGPLVATGLLEQVGNKYSFATAAPDWADRLAAFYTLYLEVENGNEAALEKFAFPYEAATGFHAFLERMNEGTGRAQYLKGHVVGPLTVAFELNDAAGRPAYYDEQLRDLVVKNLALHCRWQARRLGGYGLETIVFVDEPRVSVYGQSFYITVTREMIRQDLNGLVDEIRAAGAKAGIHSCAAVDWSLLMETRADIISLDAYFFFDSLLPFRNELADFFARGGVMAWGVVPTSELANTESIESLVQRLERYWEQLADRGISWEQFVRQALITPSCGTGMLAVELAERIYELAAGVSAALRKG